MSVLNFIIAILSILSLGLISFSFFIEIDSELYRLIEYLDFLLCIFFFGDFLKQFYIAKNRWKYFYTFGWIDLLSSIPVVNEFRYARVLRIFRVLRIIKSIKLLKAFLVNHKKQTLFGVTSLIIVLSVFVCTYLVLYFEQDVGNIKTAEDALWWTFITITTVGYGDHYPVTNEGRFLATILIMNGLVGFGALISYLNSNLNKLDKG